ncbi:hypothetical protein BU23DRAFT_579570 [Bimuria novae-zelandiae CBS 107.79]|uniref:Amino acid permease/ SLC12A domain-containing protein n=1 Tax=Bimuria novae-zelandiae CBS 107.79 TaxID=1447943 RepID=A0A6A5VDN4_9PLEO|nr:hypothetical protein BU23DRAFT_579570 [Bimuria novae-zelandiae CBS 107.79]
MGLLIGNKHASVAYFRLLIIHAHLYLARADYIDNHGEFRRSFTPRQIHVLSLGGQIGAGLFISTGTNLLNGGPGSLVLGFLVVYSISFPVSANFIEYADRFVDPTLAFAAGLSMCPNNRLTKELDTVFLVVMVGMFMLPSVWFGWFEYCAAILKFIALLIFVFAGFTMKEEPFKNGFKGFSSSVLLAVLAIGDNSFTGFLAGEAKSPRYSVGHTALLIPVRVTTIYMVCIIFISLLVPADSPSLYGASGVTASPFVMALNESGITGLPDFLNCVILIAVPSIGAEFIFIASRMLRFMSHQQLIQQWFAKVAVTLLAAIALTYCNMSAGGIEVFTWLGQIASTGYFMVWVVVAIISFRFRAALDAQNDPLFNEPLAWKCTLWPMPSILLLTRGALYTACSFYLGLYPIGADSPSVYSFFHYVIGLLLIVFSGLAYKIIFRTKMRDPAKVDLRTACRTLGEEEIYALDLYYSQSRLRRFYTLVQLW